MTKLKMIEHMEKIIFKGHTYEKQYMELKKFKNGDKLVLEPEYGETREYILSLVKKTKSDEDIYYINIDKKQTKKRIAIIYNLFLQKEYEWKIIRR